MTNSLITLASAYGAIEHKDINLPQCQQTLISLGYTLFAGFNEFVQQYGGISGYHADISAIKTFYIDPEKASQTLYQEQVALYQQQTDCLLIPVGECSNGYIVLLYGSDGKLYGGFDELLYLFGDDIHSAFDCLINGKPAIEI